ncbi:MAG: DNA-directed DNA polymerase I [Promethearchaeota archaeon]
MPAGKNAAKKAKKAKKGAGKRGKRPPKKGTRAKGGDLTSFFKKPGHSGTGQSVGRSTGAPRTRAKKRPKEPVEAGKSKSRVGGKTPARAKPRGGSGRAARPKPRAAPAGRKGEKPSRAGGSPADPYVSSHLFSGDGGAFGLSALARQTPREGRESLENWYLRALGAEGLLNRDVEEGVLLSVQYSGGLNKAYAKIYDLGARDVKIWVDNTGHEPYCLSRRTKADIESDPKITGFPGFKRVEEVEVFDLLADRKITMSKVYGNTPTDIGGGRNNIRTLLGDHNAWEARIRYHHNYIYDRGLIPGMRYRVRDGNLERIRGEVDPDLREAFEGLFKDEKKELRDFASKYLDLFVEDLPDVRRVAFDIEVTCTNGAVPNARLAKEPVISVSFCDSGGWSKVHALVRPGQEFGTRVPEFPEDLDVVFFESERDLLRETFRVLWSYPVVVSFNGDNFDVNYLYHRAKKLKVDDGEVPFVLRNTGGFGPSQTEGYLLHGVHVDLFRAFSDRSLKGYAFGNRYERNSLEHITTAFLGEGKFKHEEEIGDMTTLDLVYYNWKDAEITMRLTQFDDGIAMKILLLIARISKLPFHEVYRHAISAWIRNMIFFEHRQLDYLIPNRDELRRAKPGGRSEAPDTAGKGFKGAYVIKTVPGRHYGVVVMDFASLYPSIIKEYNLSYETVECPHPECRSNFLPGINYHACTRRMGLFAVLVGFFRDTRVKWFKPRSSDPGLPAKVRNFSNTVQSALKVFINGSYGVFGSQNFDLLCLPVAESTTAIGRSSILRTIEKANELGVRVLYGDTDSVFLEHPTDEQVRALQEWADRELSLELEPEKTYQFLALSERKKNYLGVYEGGEKYDLKGLTGKKKNTPEFIKKVMREITGMLANIRTEDDFERERQNVVNLVRRSIAKLRKKEFPLEEFAISIQMKKDPSKYTKTTPQHVKAARMFDGGKGLERGDVVTFVKTRTKEGVKPLELASLKELDVKAYDALLQGALEQVLDALDIPYDECRGIRKLDAFMS